MTMKIPSTVEHRIYIDVAKIIEILCTLVLLNLLNKLEERDKC